MLESLRLALTSTPSIAPSSAEVTVPFSPTPCVCACSPPATVTTNRAMASETMTSNDLRTKRPPGRYSFYRAWKLCPLLAADVEDDFQERLRHRGQRIGVA